MVTHLIDPIGAINSGELTHATYAKLGLRDGEWMLLLALKQIKEASGGGGVAPYQVASEPTLGSFPTAPDLSWYDTETWHYQKRSGVWYRYPQGDPLS